MQKSINAYPQAGEVTKEEITVKNIVAVACCAIGMLLVVSCGESVNPMALISGLAFTAVGSMTLSKEGGEA